MKHRNPSDSEIERAVGRGGAAYVQKLRERAYTDAQRREVDAFARKIVKNPIGFTDNKTKD